MNSNNVAASTSSYCIPRNNEKRFISTNLVDRLRYDIFDEKRITKNAGLIVGCEIIDFENRFVEILDLAYNSFLLGMYYATVSLSSLAAERITYDLIEFQEVRFGSKLVDSKQKKAFYNIPYSTLLDFLYEMKEIDKQIKK